MDLILFILIASMTIVLGTTYGVLSSVLRRFGGSPRRNRALALVASPFAGAAWYVALGMVLGAYAMVPYLMFACGPVDGFQAGVRYHRDFGPDPLTCGNSIDEGLAYCSSVDPVYLAGRQGRTVPSRPTPLPEGYPAP